MQFRLVNRTVQTLGGGKLDRGLSRYGRNKPVALRRPYRLMNERSKRG